MSDRGRKIVSFALWGDNSLYVEGAVANARLYPEIFEGWSCRFYLSDAVADDGRKIKTPPDVEFQLREAGAEVVWKAETSHCLGMYYRFLPLLDDPAETERFIVRDTDSKPSLRELEAVRAWEESGAPFHIIRDNRVHNVPILGGTWGAIPGCIPNFDKLLRAWMSQLEGFPGNPRGRYHGTDQRFLASAVWPFIAGSYLGHIRAGEPGLRFSPLDIELPPLGPDGHFVGAVI